MKRLAWSGWSLRWKLLLACVLVQLVAAVLVMFASSRLLQRALMDQASFEARQVLTLLDEVIEAPLAQRDFATLQQTLDLVRSDESIRYLVLWDHRGKVIAASGWDAAKPLPPRDGPEIDLQCADATQHLSAPVVVAGQQLGHIDLGLSTARLRQVRADFLQRSLGIGAVALVLSVLALAAIAFTITHRLARLTQASQRVAEGDFDVQVPVTSHDEIGRLGVHFNAMATALEESRRQQQRVLNVAREEQSRLATLLGAMQSGILFIDALGEVIYANDSFKRIWSVPDLKAGQSLVEIVPLLVRQTQESHATYLQAMLRAGTGTGTATQELHTLDGRIISQRMQPVVQTSGGNGYIWFHQDITQERYAQRRAYQALYDPLTKLLNRRGLQESLELAIARAEGEQSPVALLFIDLDNFKQANDVAGHRTGDEILIAVSRTLSAELRQGELVARLGGDEFALVCPGLGAADACLIAARLVQAVAALRFPTPTQVLRVGCSIGIAIYPADAQTEDDLLASADTAMYQAKQGGKNGWALARA